MHYRYNIGHIDNVNQTRYGSAQPSYSLGGWSRRSDVWSMAMTKHSLAIASQSTVAVGKKSIRQSSVVWSGDRRTQVNWLGLRLDPSCSSLHFNHLNGATQCIIKGHPATVWNAC